MKALKMITMDDLLKDVAILDQLKKDEEKNYSEILSEIRERHKRRTFLKVFASSAAAVLLFLGFHYAFWEEPEDIYSTLETPTLITDAGQSITLSNDNAYTLDLTPEPVKVPAIVAPEIEDISDPVVEKPNSTINDAATVTSNTVVIPQGYTYNIRFDDGTEAYINSGSYIEFPKSFANKERRMVALRGEGYFKVAKSDKPFIVQASGLEVTVYGTEFNVNTNKEGRVETILVTGSVGVKRSGADSEIMMVPDQLLTYNLQTEETQIEYVDPSEYLSWMTGDFTYSDRSMFELLDDVSRFYNISIEKDATLEDQLITINLSRKLGHKQLIEILESALGLEFTSTGNKTYRCKTNY